MGNLYPFNHLGELPQHVWQIIDDGEFTKIFA